MTKHKLFSIITPNILHILVFIVSFMIYFFTLPPSVSFWDCGEFISCAYKLEVGHAPGAPLYLMIARLFSIFSSPGKVAFSINILSAIASAFTIGLLFSTILIILNKLSNKKIPGSNKFAALIGSLTFAVSDTVWFSAVEAEVYALSLFFTAFTFWAALKWEISYPNKYSWKWILLISFSMGLSIGIHLLNLLIIPIITILIITKIYGKTIRNYLFATIAGILILLLVQFTFIQNGLYFAKKLELLFVNKWHFPIHSGTLAYYTLLFSILILGIIVFHYRNKQIQIIVLCVFLFVFGTSSYAMIIIRANAQPSINLNKPSDIFALESFINRTQYGERPLFKGVWFDAIQKEISTTYNYRINTDGRYELYPNGAIVKYDEKDLSFLPRMYSSQSLHKSGYLYWGNLHEGEKPTLINQIAYLFKYQIGHMYFRYFMWNFSGRQNHYQGHGDFLKGNYLTGISFIDKYSVGDRQVLNSLEHTSKARNTYFMLPLIFGIIGIIGLIKKQNWEVLYILSTFFLLMGPVISLYLNQPPFEPRERDYIFSGSFYAFSIFIAIGAWITLNKIYKTAPSKKTFWGTSVALFLGLPGLMFANNINDHNRSDRTLAKDLARSYLDCCDANSILFTYGDNDTYPLWYLQEVESIRTDVRVINAGLLSADWYIEQQTKKQNISEPLSLSIPLNRYKKGDLDYVASLDYNTEPLSILSALKFIADTSSSSKLLTINGEKIDFIPSKTLFLDTDSTISIAFKKRYLMKEEIALLDLIASNKSDRSIYFTNGTPASAMLGFKEHTAPYGIVSKIATNHYHPNTEELTELFLNKININYPQKSWFDETCLKELRISRLITNCNNLISELIESEDKEKAQLLMIKFNPIITAFEYQFEEESINCINNLFKIQLTTQATIHLKQYTYKTIQDLNFYIQSQDYLGNAMSNYAGEEYSRLQKLYQIAQINKVYEVKTLIEKTIGTSINN